MKTGVLCICSLVFLAGCKKADYLYEKSKATSVSQMSQTHNVEQIVFKDKLDILWVIDNSDSMNEEQKRVINTIASFVDEFKVRSVNKWKMGLITTDDGRNPYAGFTDETAVTSDNPHSVEIFKSAIGAIGLGGSGFEKTFDPVMKALMTYPNFIRDHALLALVIVSDEREQSRIFSMSQFVSALKQIKGSLDDIHVYGVLNGQEFCGPFPVPNFCPDCHKGSVYEKFLEVMHGKFFPICKDFSENLLEIAADLARKISSFKIFLQRRPVISSIEVRYDGQVLPGGSPESGAQWFYDYYANAIVFHHTEKLGMGGKTVTVSYQVQR